MASRVYLFLPVAHAAESNFMFPLQATDKLTQTLTNDWPPFGSIFRKEGKTFRYLQQWSPTISNVPFFIMWNNTAGCKVCLADSVVANAHVLCSL